MSVNKEKYRGGICNIDGSIFIRGKKVKSSLVSQKNHAFGFAFD